MHGASDTSVIMTAGCQLAFTSHGSTLQCVTGIHALALMCSKAVTQDVVTAASGPVHHQLQQQLKHQSIKLRQLPFKVR